MINKIACQCITWGDLSSVDQINQMLREIKEAGFDGVEYGLDQVELFEQASYDDIGIVPYAAHAGIDFRGRNPIEAVEEKIPLLDKVAALGSKLVFISSLFFQSKSAEDYAIEAEGFNAFGKLIKERGMTLCYHNHHWEFKKNSLGFNIFFQNTDPEYVSLVPDVGWVTRGDVDPVEFIEEHVDRIKSIHFKEFTFDDHFTELGRGIVEFERIYQAIKDMDLWIVAEQDTCTGKPVDSARVNAQYLKDLMAKYN